jgi:hypothetical protein
LLGVRTSTSKLAFIPNVMLPLSSQPLIPMGIKGCDNALSCLHYLCSPYSCPNYLCFPYFCPHYFCFLSSLSLLSLLLSSLSLLSLFLSSLFFFSLLLSPQFMLAPILLSSLHFSRYLFFTTPLATFAIASHVSRSLYSQYSCPRYLYCHDSYNRFFIAVSIHVLSTFAIATLCPRLNSP